MTSAVPATSLILWLAVALGGALGALARYSVSVAWMPAQLKFPVATLTVNVLGSFLMGVFYVVIVEKAMLAPLWRHAIMIGFLGAFTTFSTFSIESLHLWQSGHWQVAISYVVANVVLSISAVVVAIVLTEKLV